VEGSPPGTAAWDQRTQSCAWTAAHSSDPPPWPPSLGRRRAAPPYSTIAPACRSLSHRRHTRATVRDLADSVGGVVSCMRACGKGTPWEVIANVGLHFPNWVLAFLVRLAHGRHRERPIRDLPLELHHPAALALCKAPVGRVAGVQEPTMNISPGSGRSGHLRPGARCFRSRKSRSCIGAESVCISRVR
jgi:hypothetical protein